MVSNRDICDLMTKEQKVLCDLLANSLFGVPFEPEDDVEWEKVINESKSQSVTLVAFQNQKLYSTMEEKLKNQLSKALTAVLLNGIRVRRNHAYLHKLMDDAGIKYCIFKGPVSAQYYPQPLLRVMGDVDFFVLSEDVESTKQVLIDNGFELEKYKKGEYGHHIGFIKEKKVFELHFDIPGTPDGAVGDLIRDYFADVIDKSEEYTEEYVTYNNPSAFHHGFVMLLHMQHHIVVEGMGLRHLCDWAVFLNKFKSNEFTELFKEKMERAGLWNFARIISLVACMCLKMPHQDWICENESDIEIAKGIIADILSGGNFGRKKRDRGYEGLMISIAGRDGANKGKFLRSIESINKIINVHWPIARKVPVLYPVGWVFFVLRLFVMIALGKRPKFNLFTSFKESDRRSELYASLKLFEPDDQ